MAGRGWGGGGSGGVVVGRLLLGFDILWRWLDIRMYVRTCVRKRRNEDKCIYIVRLIEYTAPIYGLFL